MSENIECHMEMGFSRDSEGNLIWIESSLVAGPPKGVPMIVNGGLGAITIEMSDGTVVGKVGASSDDGQITVTVQENDGPIVPLADWLSHE